MLNYHTVINHFIKERFYSSYLELGVRDKHATFNNVCAKIKIGVDLNRSCLPDFVGTTDEFFATNKQTWDIIFIDACHEANQVMRDFDNSLKVLREGGLIIMDDINPEEEWLTSQNYCGDAWITFSNLRKREDLKVMGVEGTRFGLVEKGTQIPFDKEIIPVYSFLEENRNKIMNFIAFDKF